MSRSGGNGEYWSASSPSGAGRGAAGFDDHQTSRPNGKPMLELAAGEPVRLGHIPVVIIYCDLEYNRGQIHGNGHGMHGGVLILKIEPHPEHRRLSLGAEEEGESIPSIERTSSRKPSAAAHVES